jgi:hypothetical protein
MKRPFISFAILLAFGAFFAQQDAHSDDQDTVLTAKTGRFVVEGAVYDKDTGEPIPGATVQVLGTKKAMPTNADGRFILVLEKGDYDIKVSHVGHYSEKFTVSPTDSSLTMDVRLRPLVIYMGERRVYTRAYDPAQKIIAAAIARKKDILSRFHDYSYDSYAKFFLSDPAKADLENIFIIIESQTTSYWEWPNKYKEVITARQQSANIPSNADVIMVVGEMLNFNKNRIELDDYRVVSPTATDAMDHYNYYLLDTVYYDERAVFVLEMEPRNEYEPLLAGEIHIIDSTFEVVRVDGSFSKGLNFPFIKNARYYQHLAPIEGEYWLPVQIGFSGQIDFNMPLPGVPSVLDFEYVASIYSYQIETGHPKGTFDEYEIVINEDADDIDSAAWAARQTIPLTEDEQRGYRRIDSLENLPRPIGKQVARGFLAAVLLFMFGDYDLFHYNRVEGPYLGPKFELDRLNHNARLRLKTGYAFKDKRWQYRYGVSYRLHRRQKLWLGVTVKDEIVHRATIISKPSFNPTFNSLLFRTDPFDYYREKGYEVLASVKPVNHTRLKVGYHDSRHLTKSKRTGYGIFRRSINPRENPAIAEGKMRAVTASLSYDSRKLIKSKGRDLISFYNRYTRAEAGIEYASPDIVDNDFHFRRYYLEMKGRYRIPELGIISLFGYLGSSDWELPPQKLFIADYNDPYMFKKRGFSTFGENNFGGDRVALIYAYHDFGKYIFRSSGVELLKKIPFGFAVYGGAFWSEFRNSPVDISIRTAPTAYAEIGFGLTNLTPSLGLFNLAAYFTWQLSAYDTETFIFSVGFDI